MTCDYGPPVYNFGNLKTKIQEVHVWTAGCNVVDDNESRPHSMMTCTLYEKDSVLLGNGLFWWNDVNMERNEKFKDGKRHVQHRGDAPNL
jgi:hypothetical protein